MICLTYTFMCAVIGVWFSYSMPAYCHGVKLHCRLPPSQVPPPPRRKGGNVDREESPPPRRRSKDRADSTYRRQRSPTEDEGSPRRRKSSHDHREESQRRIRSIQLGNKRPGFKLFPVKRAIGKLSVFPHRFQEVQTKEITMPRKKRKSKTIPIICWNAGTVCVYLVLV